MKISKTMAYYVAAMGKRFYYGSATRDMLKAQITLAEARRVYPGEEWGIVAYAA